MARYFTIKPPVADDWWESTAAPLPHPSVYPSEPIATGLVDVNGADIYRGPDQIGFLKRSDER